MIDFKEFSFDSQQIVLNTTKEGLSPVAQECIDAAFVEASHAEIVNYERREMRLRFPYFPTETTLRLKLLLMKFNEHSIQRDPELTLQANHDRTDMLVTELLVDAEGSIFRRYSQSKINIEFTIIY